MVLMMMRGRAGIYQSHCFNRFAIPEEEDEQLNTLLAEDFMIWNQVVEFCMKSLDDGVSALILERELTTSSRLSTRSQLRLLMTFLSSTQLSITSTRLARRNF